MLPRLDILVVEDDANIRAIIELSLGLDPSMTVRTVEYGWEAIEEVERDEVSFDLILLDGILSDMSGAALITAVHANPKTKNLPVIILTALRSNSELDHLADAGANAVMEKPFDPISLANQLRAHLALRDGRCVRWWASDPSTR
ncbi:response regulator [Sphingomonas glacialis]|nr:response regulator [Sphingomonas glacialis]